NAGLVAADPVTFVKLGHLDGKVLLSLLGLAFTAWLHGRKSPFAFLAGIALVTGLAVALGYATPPKEWVSAPDLSSVLFKLDIAGALKVAYLPAILAVVFTDLFDSLSTF